METPIPLPAATLVLLRPEPEGFSVLLMQRPAKSSFMGGMHVFPGGKVEPSDYERPTEGLSGRLAGPMRLDPREAGGYIQAALRETFEEMGLLPGVVDCAAAERQHARAALAENPAFWNGWSYTASEPLAPVVYFDHWITPTFEAKRFDTRFFATVVEPNSRPEPNHEAVHWQFYRPSQALAAFRAGEIRLAPPTLITILRLADYDSGPKALAGLAARRVSPLLPIMVNMEPVTMALPGHPEHPVQEAEADNPTQLVLDNGEWIISWKQDARGLDSSPT